MGIGIKLENAIFKNNNFGRVTEHAENLGGYLQYVEFDGNSFIDTGFTGFRDVGKDSSSVIPNDVPRMQIEVLCLGEDKEHNAIWGATGSKRVDNTCMFLGDANIPTNLKIDGKGATGIFTVTSEDYHKIEYGSVKTFIDDVLVKDNTDMSNQYRLNPWGENTYKIGKAIYNAAQGQKEYYGQIRVKYFRAYLGDKLVADLRPFQQLDGTVCFKDDVSGSIYLNRGVGRLTAGPFL